MKQLNQYQCECCNTVYKLDKEATTCESEHLHIVKVVSELFNSYKNGGKYPKSITCKMSDGSQKTFKLE